MKNVIIALGGNVLHSGNRASGFNEQFEQAVKAAEKFKRFLKDGDCKIALTHGNGPQIGNILLQQSSARSAVSELPMFVCDAMTQGQIGYMLQLALDNFCADAGIKREVAAIVTCVEVDEKDSAFKKLSKPVGPFYNEDEIKKMAEESGYIFKEDAGRGWRRVVASPEPVRIVEIEAIKKMFNEGIAVIAAGGGGVPVISIGGRMKGIDAVIDKDKTSSLLACELEADMFIILTSVEKVRLNYGQLNERPLDKISVDEAKQYLAEGHFAEGSMKPKIEAALNFLAKRPKGKVLITHHDYFEEAIKEKNGTWITNN